MKEDIKQVVAILDMSGSMSNMANDTICGFNSYVQELQKAEGEIYITLIVFSTESRTVWERVPVKQCGTIGREIYKPGGGTALTDAIGIAIDGLQRYVQAQPEEIKPG